jgi:hypothetical protein
MYPILGPRATNHIEGWHKKLNDQAGRAHPNIFKFVEIIKKIQQETTISQRELEHRVPAVRRRKAYTRVDEQILRLKNRLMANDINAHDYICAVSHLLKY